MDYIMELKEDIFRKVVQYPYKSVVTFKLVNLIILLSKDYGDCVTIAKPNLEERINANKGQIKRAIEEAGKANILLAVQSNGKRFKGGGYMYGCFQFNHKYETWAYPKKGERIK